MIGKSKIKSFIKFSRAKMRIANATDVSLIFYLPQRKGKVNKNAKRDTI